jgi:hypothetical protein
MAKTDVAVGVTAGVVAVGVENPGVATVVVVATRVRHAYSIPYLLWLLIQPPTILPISTDIEAQISYFFWGKNPKL